jgi:hypothetical protein
MVECGVIQAPQGSNSRFRSTSADANWEKHAMNISKGAEVIFMESRWPERNRDKLKSLIEKYGIDAAAEALELLGQIVPQTGNVSFNPRQSGRS